MTEPVDFSKMTPERIELSQRDFAALEQRLAEPGQYDPRVAKVLSTPAPWDNRCSNCCGAPLKIAGEGTTHWWVCTACAGPCDAVNAGSAPEHEALPPCRHD